MPVILFVMYPLMGPVYSSLRVARLLSRRSYRIVYIAPPAHRGLVEQEGYEFETLIEQDAGLEEGRELDALKAYNSLLNGVKGPNSPLLRRIGDIVERYHPCAAMVDADVAGLAITFYGHDIPVVLLNGHFIGDKAPFIPPYFSAIIPDGSLSSFLIIECVWRVWLMRKYYSYLARKISSLGRDDSRQKRLAKICGFPYKRAVDSKRTWLYGFRTIPEFYLYPMELDFPHCRPKSAHYFAGPMLDAGRREGGFDWDRIKNVNPIVLCSLGTVAHVYYPGYCGFLETLIDIFRERPEFNLIIAAGSCYGSIRESSLFPNIILCRSVPQQEILRRASLMINHAGINSVKECISSGVPMMAYPLSRQNDQPGTAARIVFHRLGRRGNIYKDTRQQIAMDLDLLLRDDSYRENVMKMKAVFDLHAANEETVIDRIESFFKPACPNDLNKMRYEYK